MKFVVVISVVAVTFFSGCDKLVVTAGEDQKRLAEIDAKFNQGDFEYALTESQKYLESYPKSYQGWCMLGWVHQKMDQPEKARECFDQSIAINPEWDNAYVGNGATYRSLGDNENARKSYLEAIRILPENAEAYSSLLVIELLEGNDEKAVEYGEKAWGFRKDLAGIPANLSVAYHYLGEPDKRDYFYKEAEKLGYHRLETLVDIFEGRSGLR